MGYFIPGIIFIPWNNNKKYQKWIYPTEFRLKTLKKLFLGALGKTLV